MRQAGKRLAVAGLVLACAALRAEPAMAEVDRALARVAVEASLAGDHDAAQRHVAALLAASPNEFLTWRVQGWVLSRAGFPEQALAAYDEAVRLQSEDYISLNNGGALLLGQGKVEEALARFDRVLAARPRYADAHNNRGAALQRLGRRAEARVAYQEAARRWPRLAEAHNNLGVLAFQRGAVAKAASAFRRAAAFDPQFAAPTSNLALIQEGGVADEATAVRLEAAAAADTEDTGLRLRALAARAAVFATEGKWGEARARYLEALELAPENARLLNNLGVVEDNMGLDREALLHLGEAAALTPDMHVVRNNMGVVHVHRGDLDLAEGAFRALIEADSRFHRAHYNLGVVLSARGRVEEAHRSFQTALDLSPNDPEALYNVTMLRRRMGGTPAEERAGYERALAMDPYLAEAHLSLGTLLADPATPTTLRNEAQAVVHLERFLELARGTDRSGREQADAWLAWLARRPTR